jgi:hypothetical protein
MTRIKEKAVHKEAIRITSPFGDPAADILNAALPSENYP